MVDDSPEFEGTEWPGHRVASEVSERIREIIGAAEAAATALRHEAEEQSQARRRAAEEEARQVIEDARRDAEALLAERLRRISELSDTILERGESVLSKLSRAEEVRQQLEELVDALGDTASNVAREMRGDLPGAGPSPAGTSASAAGVSPPRPAGRPPPRPLRGAEPPVAPAFGGEEPAADAGEIVDAELAEDSAEGESSPARERAAPFAATDQSADAVTAPSPGAAVAAESEKKNGDELLGARLVALQMAVAGGNRGEVSAHLRRAFALPDPESILDDVFGPGTDASKRVAWPSTAEK